MVTTRSLHTVYSFTSDFSNLLCLVLFLLLAVVFFFLTKLCLEHIYGRGMSFKQISFRYMMQNKSLQVLAGCFFMSSVLVVISTLSLYNFVSSYLKKPIKSIEGSVSNFTPMPSGGHGEESFEVNDVYFHYSQGQLGLWAYRKTTVEGGVIKPNLYVRITYLESDSRNEILKLETE